ncbi:MAG TPA: T9SS type A sorting domain-containing protein [Fluviicola sp.]|nr:T9SS type A sorting domain-containing protein [Fluviicola sp.]
MMQRLAYLIVFCALTLSVWGQKTVTQGEYFWDTDPGQGNGIALTATDGSFDETLEDLFANGIDVSALSVGAHSFNVRIQGQNGTWSNVFKQTIVVQGPLSIITRTINVTQGEYFWDTDPGAGNGTPLLATDGTFDEALEDLFQTGINVSALSLGAHSFNVRIKGQDANWSGVFKQTIYLEGPLTTITRSIDVTQGEYFWDTDPGTGNGTPLFATDGAFDEALEDLFRNGIDVSALSLGAHSFNVRIKGQDANWSGVFKQTIYLEGPLTAITRTTNVTQGEYFWDTDPGTGNGTPLFATDGTFDEVLEDLFRNGIDVSALSLGAHSFNVRIKGQDANWSPVFKQTIYLEGPLTTITRTTNVTQGEYFWDTDPGTGNGTPLFVTDGNFDEALEELFRNGIDVSALSVGAHSFNVRIKGQNPTWSAVFKQTIYIEGPLTLLTRNIRITQGEYFWDTDPGQGNGTPLLAADGTFNTALENLLRNGIDVSPLSLGAHAFSVRVKGLDGNWSGVFKQTIYIECSAPTAPSISIAVTGNGACQGTTVQFTATAVNGGPTPTYLWKVNGTPAGTNSPFFNTSTLVNGDVVTCELTSNSGCASPLTASSNAINVTLTPTVTPTLSVAASPGTTVCAGTNVTFTATTTNGGGSPVYQWKVNGLDVGTNSATYSSSTLLNGDVVTCVFTSSATCAVPSQLTSSGTTITVQPVVTPSVLISVSPGTTICAGTSVTFTASPTNGGTPSYQWKVNGSNVGTNSATYVTSSLNNGDVVTCEMTSSLSCVTSSTATSNGISMAVNPTVSTGITIASGSGTIICQGTSVTFTATPVNGGSPGYQWKVNGMAVGTNASTYTTSTLVNGDVVTCEMTSSLPCSSPAIAVSNSIVMTVNSTAAPTASISSSQGSTVCAGTTVNFTASGTNLGSSPSYQWKLNGSNVGSDQNTYSNSALTGGDVVTCVITSNAPCVSGSMATSNSITFTVTTPVTPSVSISSNAGSAICAGTSVTFTASPTNGGTPSYQWQVNGSNVGTNSATYATSSLANGDIVTCILTTSLTCVTNGSATSNSITMTVNPSVSTSVSIASSAGSTICAGTSVTFTATPVNGGTPTFVWKVNGFTVGTNSATYVTSSLNNGDVVTCEMSSSLACPNPSTAISNSIVMTVNSTAAPTISISSSQGASICAGTTVNFTSTITNGGPSPVYQWKLNGSNVGTNASTYSNSALANGDVVTCELTSSAPCVSGSTATSNSIVFTVTTPVTPSVSISSNAGSTICAGTSVTFTATPTNGGTPAYQWQVNGSNVGTNSATYATSSLNNGDVVTCVMTTSLTCVTTGSATSSGITMTVNPTVATSVSIASSAGSTICSGTSITFTATPVNGGTPTYQWKVNGLPVGTNSATYVTNGLNNGDIVTCEMTSSLTCPSPATAISNSITMTVNPTAAPTISIASAQGVNTCEGTTVNFTASITNGGPSPVYQWMLNGSNVGTNSSTYSNSTLVTGDVVTCELTSNAPCATVTSVTSNSLTFTVNPVVVPSVSIVSSAGSTICSGTSVTFTATPTNGGTPTYQWQVNGSNVGTNAPTYTTSSLANGSVVTCLLTSSTVCATPATVVSNSITMTVNSSAAPTISISSNPAGSICSGTNVTFTASISNGGASPVYQWKLNGTNVGSNQNTYSNAALANGDVVTCELTSNAPCISVTTVTSNSITMTVNQSVTPTITITSNPAMPVCDQQSVTFTAVITNGGSNPSYQWKKNGQNYGLNSPTYSTSLWSDGDVFTCVLTSNAACATSSQVTSNAITADIVTIDATTTVMSGTITANQSGATYQWFDCATMQNIPGANQQSYTPDQTGLYAVEITMGSCVEESGCEFVDPNGLTDLSAAGIVLYPNPATDYFTLDIPNIDGMQLTLYDVAGRKVMEQNVQNHHEQVDVHALANGSYKVVLSNGHATYFAKMIINR